MSLKDLSNGPEWVLWVVVVLFAVLSAVLLSGHGAMLIAGYNTADESEKNKYDSKKLCRVTGGGMSVITVIILIMALFKENLPESFASVAMTIILLVCVAIIFLSKKICRK